MHGIVYTKLFRPEKYCSYTGKDALTLLVRHRSRGAYMISVFLSVFWITSLGPIADISVMVSP